MRSPKVEPALTRPLTAEDLVPETLADDEAAALARVMELAIENRSLREFLRVALAELHRLIRVLARTQETVRRLADLDRP